MSTSTRNDPPSGASRIVAGPRTVTVQPAGATKVLPSTVVRGVSAGAALHATCIAADRLMTMASRHVKRIDARMRATIAYAPPALSFSEERRLRWWSDACAGACIGITGRQMHHEAVIPEHHVVRPPAVANTCSGRTTGCCTGRTSAIGDYVVVARQQRGAAVPERITGPRPPN